MHMNLDKKLKNGPLTIQWHDSNQQKDRNEKEIGLVLSPAENSHHMTSSVHLMLRRKENNLSDRICLDISEVTLVMSVHMQFLVLLATLPSVVLSLTILKPGKSRSVLCSFCRTRYSYLKLFLQPPSHSCPLSVHDTIRRDSDEISFK